MIEGGCFCGRVRFRVAEGEYEAVDCHCSMCRRVHAAPYVTWLVVPLSRFEYTREAPAVLQSSESGTRDFCPACGTHVACRNRAHPKIIDVPLGSLDNPEGFAPARAFYVDTRLPWIT